MRTIVTRSQAGTTTLLLAGLLTMMGATETFAQCDPGGLDKFRGPVEYGGMDLRIYHTHKSWKDCNKAGDYISDAVINQIPPIMIDAFNRQVGDWGFQKPWVDSLPDFDLYVFDGKDTGTANSTCITLDAPNARCRTMVDTTGTNTGLRWVLSHEQFHEIQRRYIVNGGLGGSSMSSWLGKWFVEGTARCLDDRYDMTLDSGSVFLSEVNRLMTGWNSDLNVEHRRLSLFDSSYRAGLFWSYCCEQLAYDGEPQSGVEFVRRLWQQVWFDLDDAWNESEGVWANPFPLDLKHLSPVGFASRTIIGMGGSGLRKMYHDYATCLYTREFDATALPNPDRYVFIDETPAGLSGGNRYSNMIREGTFFNTTFPSTATGLVPHYGQKIYEAFLLRRPDGCEAVGVRGTATSTAGWSLVGVKEEAAAGLPARATILSKSVGKNYARAFITNANDRLLRLGVVVVGREALVTGFELTFDDGPMTIEIIDPTADSQAYPGRADEEGRFLMAVFVDGPSGLKPQNGSNISIKGLRPEDFDVRVGTEPAKIISAAYVGGEYQLVVQAPKQPGGNGAYSLTVCLCPGMSGAPTHTQADAVLHGNYTVNHMVVIDISGSMSFPTDGGSKMDAAKTAGTLYLDAANDNNRVGVTWFGQSDPDCDDNARTILGLGTATGVHRTLGKIAINNLFPEGSTSIGDGLWLAQDEFDNFPGGLTPEDLRFVLLLSDGEENTPRFWDRTEPGCAGDAGDKVRSRIEPSLTRVTALAFGPEANAKLMQDIGDQTGGPSREIDVTDSAALGSAGSVAAGTSELSMVSNLANAYMKQIQIAESLERLFFDSGNIDAAQSLQLNIPVTEAGVEQARVFVNWPSSAGAVTVELRDPANALITAAQAMILTEPTHVVYHLPGVMANGTWTISITPTNATEFIVGLVGRLRLGVQLITAVGQENTGNGTFGKFEQGVPVKVVALLTDSLGPVLGATASATVRRPDGTLSCAALKLMDDGLHDDGEPDDGVYAAIYTDTSQAGTLGGVNNDNPPSNPGGVSGGYLVTIIVAGAGNAGQAFVRFDDVAFHIFESDRNDLDMDGLPDTWERYYGTTVGIDDSEFDNDGDGLVNVKEFLAGCDPFDEDTDDGGESDFSEVAAGRCPLHPDDDLLPCPIDAGVMTTVGDMDTDILKPLANLLHFPVHPSYQSMRVLRADQNNPTNFVLVADLPVNGINDNTHYDGGLVDGMTYFYQFQAVGAGGALSCKSRVVQATARAEPLPPLGWVTINSNDERTDSANVLLSLDLTTSANRYRVSNAPISGVEPLLALPASPYVNWTMTLPAPGGTARVYVQYANTIAGTTSDVFEDDIIFDPNGDPDGDGVPNVFDPDDDGDGLSDFNEVFVHHTNAYRIDSDGDGLSDGDEVNLFCTVPRNPDSDADGIPDGADASPALLEATVVGMDTTAGDHFGTSTAMSRDVAVVGAEGHVVSSIQSGAVYVLRRNGSNWSQESQLAPPIPVTGDRFGSSVAASGDVILVGARGDDAAAPDAGAAYMFRHNGVSWVPEQPLTASDPATADGYGASVALSGDAAVVGASGNDEQGSEAGAAYVYRFDAMSGVWTQEAKLTATDAAAGDEFGSAVDIDGDVIVVGAMRKDAGSNDAGSAYVFRFNGTTWVQEQQVVAFSGSADDLFGISVAVHGDLLVVGANGDDDVSTDSGAAYVYRFDSGSSQWADDGKLTGSGSGFWSFFGESVALTGETIVVGAPQLGAGLGEAYSFINVGGAWTEQLKFTACDGTFNDLFGAAVASNDDTALVGAWSNDCVAGADCGSAYLYSGVLDCNGNDILDAIEIFNETAFDGDADGILDECDPTEVLIVPAGESAEITPMGVANDPTEAPVIHFGNNSGSPAEVSVTLSPTTVNPGDGTFSLFGQSLDVETDLPDGTFEMSVSIPFTEADLLAEGLTSADLGLVDLRFYNELTLVWDLAVDGNCGNPPMCDAGAVGSRFQITDTTTSLPPSGILGDYGVFYNTTTMKGYVWAVVDHTTEFSTATPSCGSTSAPHPDLLGDVLSTKNRTLSFETSGTGAEQAVRVIFQDLASPFHVLNARQMWVGAPFDLSQLSGKDDTTPPTFKAASLQCDPFFMDWSAVGLVHVFHETIVPNSLYRVQLITTGCAVDAEDNFSEALMLDTSVWGDVAASFDANAGQWTAPDGIVGVASDVVALLDKFKNAPTAPSKARTDIQPALVDFKITIVDVTLALDAFSGQPYPFVPSSIPCAN